MPRTSHVGQVRNGFRKAAVTFAGATAENTLGYAMGLGDFILSGFEDFDESMTQNPVGRFVDEANEYAREHLPNYYTKEEEANTGKVGNIFTANFLADKFLNGAAYHWFYCHYVPHRWYRSSI